MFIRRLSCVSLDLQFLEMKPMHKKGILQLISGGTAWYVPFIVTGKMTYAQHLKWCLRLYGSPTHLNALLKQILLILFYNSLFYFILFINSLMIRLTVMCGACLVPFALHLTYHSDNLFLLELLLIPLSVHYPWNDSLPSLSTLQCCQPFVSTFNPTITRRKCVDPKNVAVSKERTLLVCQQNCYAKYASSLINHQVVVQHKYTTENVPQKWQNFS